MEELTRDYEGRIHYTRAAVADVWTHDDALSIIQMYRRFIGLGLIPPDNILRAIDGYFKAYLESDGRKSLDRAFRLQSKPGSGHPLVSRKNNSKTSAACFIMWFDMHTDKIHGNELPTFIEAAQNVIDEFNIKSQRNKNEPFDADTLARYYRKYKYGQATDEACLKFGLRSEFMQNMLNNAIAILQVID